MQANLPLPSGLAAWIMPFFVQRLTLTKPPNQALAYMPQPSSNPSPNQALAYMPQALTQP